LQYWAQTNNCNETPQITSIQSSSYPLEHYSYSGGDSSVVAELYKVIGGDHYWLNFSIDQKNTNWIMWEFFDQFDIYGKR
jgi:poly(3-hydroxybutyrate) depolymerase